MASIWGTRIVPGFKRSAKGLLGHAGYEIRRMQPVIDPRTERYIAGAREIHRRHAAQTPEIVAALRARYAEPVFGQVRVWDLVERLAQCIDPSDCLLACTSQQTHVLQMLEEMQRDGVDDPDLLLAVLVHDLGKLLLVAGEDPANVVCMNSPMGANDDGEGLDNCEFQWNHDEFGYSRLKDHVPDHIAWLIRYHSMDAVECAALMDDRDRDYTARYFNVFTHYDHDTKAPFNLPALRLDAYRDLIEDAFPRPIPF